MRNGQAIESWYLLWRATGDSKWRDRGWEMFKSIERHARFEDAYASLSNVDALPAPLADDMPRLAVIAVAFIHDVLTSFLLVSSMQRRTSYIYQINKLIQ